MKTNLYQKAIFLLSVAELEQLPPDQGYEVVFAGRSNVGKSSVLNQVTRNKNLARVSKTPGRTQCINFFGLDAHKRLVDLPGYGYAKVPVEMRKKWENTIADYLRSRTSLRGLVLVMDIRHPFTELDQQLLAFCQHYDLPVHIVLNKADKLTQRELTAAIKTADKALVNYADTVSFQGFSAKTGTGLRELCQLLDKWLQL